MPLVIILKAQLTIRPEHRAAFVQQMQTLIQASLAEAGCLSFGCYEDVALPHSFVVLEEWESHAALTQHEGSAHVAAFKARVSSMIVARQPTRVYTVSHTEGLPAQVEK